MKPLAISVSNLSFGYQTNGIGISNILSGASFAVCKGEIVCILGESGSGKTTLLNLINGTLKPQGGKIIVDGVISYLQQDDVLLPFRTAWQNACLAIEIRLGLSEESIRDATSVLERMKLSNSLSLLPFQMSGGMRRRVALARQILPPSDVFLLDEPLGEQDRATREVLEDMLYARCRVQRSAALVVIHDLESAVALCDRVIILDSKRTIGRDWFCPATLLAIPPSARRKSREFTDSVAELWRRLWEATDHAL